MRTLQDSLGLIDKDGALQAEQPRMRGRMVKQREHTPTHTNTHTNERTRELTAPLTSTLQVDPDGEKLKGFSASASQTLLHRCCRCACSQEFRDMIESDLV